MIDTIINYCSVDKRFIDVNINQCLQFSDRVIIPICDHLFDGTPENFDLITPTIEKFADNPKVMFIEYEWDNTHKSKYHHNMSRWVGLQFVENEYVLLIDADEVIEGDLMKSYLEHGNHLSYDVVSFRCYWYFREPIYRAIPTEMAGVLYKKALCDEHMIFHKEERWAFREHRHLDIKEDETYNNKVLCNHYSWVRSKEEMMKKVSSWGHSTEKNWDRLVEQEFSREFSGTDFIHGYKFEIVESKLQGDIQ